MDKFSGIHKNIYIMYCQKASLKINAYCSLMMESEKKNQKSHTFQN